MNTTSLTLALAVALAGTLASGCASDLTTPSDDADPMEASDSAIVTVQEGAGVFVTTVRAEADSAWQYFDFETQSAVSPNEPEDAPDWDLGFQRFRIKSNGGISGSGGVEVAFLFGEDFTAVSGAGTAAAWVEDRADGDDPDSAPDYAFNTPHAGSETGWYIYNPLDHTVGPTEMVHLVKTVEGRLVKLQLAAYYAADGAPAHPKFRWSFVDDVAPSP